MSSLMYQMASSPLVILFFHTWLSVVCVEGGVIHRNLLIFGSDDDDGGGSSDGTSFDFNFDENVSLPLNSVKPLCFRHHVDCIKYTSRALEAGTGNSVTVLVFAAPRRLAKRLEKDRKIVANGVVEGSECTGPFCDRSDGIDTDTDEDMCVVLVNSEFKFVNATDLEDFSPSANGMVFVSISIKGCPTASQRIVAIVVPVTVFIGVAACFSAWWVRRRRKEHMGTNDTPSREMAAVAHPPARQQVHPMGQPYVQQGQIIGVTARPGLMSGNMTGPYLTAQVPPQDKYPMKFANV